MSYLGKKPYLKKQAKNGDTAFNIDNYTTCEAISYILPDVVMLKNICS